MKLLAALGLTAGVVLGGVGVTEAGTYFNSTACNHSVLTKRVCVDISNGTVAIYNGASAVAYPASWSGAIPTRGWIAYDFECNANGANDTSFATGGGYGLPASVYITATGGAVFPGKVLTSVAGRDHIAWVANSNTGYACFVVP